MAISAFEKNSGNDIPSGDSRIYLPPEPDRSRILETVRFSDTTPAVTMYFLALLFLLIPAVGYVKWTGGMRGPMDPMVARYFIAMACASPLAAAIGYLIEAYYSFEAAEGRIIYHFRFLIPHFCWKYADFDSIYAFGVTGVRDAGLNEKMWTYKLVMVMRDGASFDVTDARPASDLTELNTRAASMAALARCLAAECGGCEKLIVGRSGHGHAEIRFGGRRAYSGEEYKKQGRS